MSSLKQKSILINQQISELRRVGIVSFKGKRLISDIINDTQIVMGELIDRLERIEEAAAFIQEELRNAK